MDEKPEEQVHREQGIAANPPRTNLEAEDARSYPFEAKPVCRLPRQPPPQEADDPVPEQPVPLYLPMIWLPHGGERSSSAVAAFHLGHLSFSMWSWAELLWDEFARRSGGSFRQDGSFTGVHVAAERLREARRDLVDSISPGRFAMLAMATDGFVRCIDQLIDRYERGTLDQARYRPGHPPWESVDRELRIACERALDVDHPLGEILELGIACGLFDVSVRNFYSYIYLKYVIEHNEIPEDNSKRIPGRRKRAEVDDPSVPAELGQVEVPVPSIRDLANRASVLPETVLEGSPLLRSLSGIAVDYDELGDDAAIRRYLEENRERWSFLSRGRETGRAEPFEFRGADGEVLATLTLSRDPDRDFDAPLTISGMAIDQVRLIEEDLARIAGSPAEPGEGNEIKWDEHEGELSIGSEVICPVARQASNIRPILNRFQALHWPEKIRDPLVSAGGRDPQALAQALTDLNVKTKGYLQFSQKSGFVLWTRAENPQNSQ